MLLNPILEAHTASIAVFVLALVLASHSPCHAQEAPPADAVTDEHVYPQASTSELRTEFFRPVNVNLNEIKNLAEEFHGRQIWVTERGGRAAPPVENIQRLGDSLLIYDVDERVREILAWLVDTDSRYAAHDEQDAPTSLAVIEWSPRHVSLQSAWTALEPFRRMVMTLGAEGVRSQVPNLSLINDRGLLVIRDEVSQLDAMKQLLERIDVPEPQLFLTCLVIVGDRSASASSPGLPADLVSDLAKLVPYEHFRIESLGMVRTSAFSKSIELRTDNKDSLELRPDAWDEQTSTLSAQCRFNAHTGFNFETRTALSTGEYTVLGASGTQPLFAVLRIESL